jgi:small-conductance mechanosensitive channel
VIAASLSGYVALGRFIVGHILLTGSGLMLLFLLHLATRAFAGHLEDDGHAVGRLLASRFKIDGERRERIAAFALVALNVLLALVGGPLLLLSWGFSPGEILGWLNSLIFGFDVGHFRISLAKLLIAGGLFLGVVFVTRLLQRWLDAQVFPKARLDAGVTHSVRTGISYGGFGLAALAAVSYAGLDISNLAIVAGALSVGIGFGLQSIVNNFVSGLILLVERPIKVGDWIVVKDREGVVRSINVRATEIETFDRSSLIVPNSELITGPVVNWTHRNSVGRIVIKVGVAYGNDPELVRRLLLEVAEKNKEVLSHPKPVAVLDNLGDSALEFSLRAYLGDINTALSVQTDLRIAILRTFAEAGIRFPVPQTEVILKDLEAIKSAIGGGR